MQSKKNSTELIILAKEVLFCERKISFERITHSRLI